MLLSQALSPVALKNSTKPAFKYLKHTISYKEYWETSSRFSYFLQKEIGHGVRVGLFMSNCPQYVYCFIAIANTKGCAVPLNPSATPDENLYKIKTGEVKVILCSSDHTRKLKEMLQQNGLGTIKVIDMEGKRCAEYDASYTPPANHPPNEKDEILLMFTPGTTGKYKGCFFNHNAIVTSMNAVRGAYRALATDCFFTQGHFSQLLHFMHYLMVPLSAGSTVFISDNPDPKTVLQNLVEFRVTRMAPNVTWFLEMIKTSIEEKLPIASLRYISMLGTSLSKGAFEIIKKYTKVGVFNVYGMTEYLGTIAMSTPDTLADPAKPGFIGPPLMGTKIRVVDDNNDEIDKKKPQRGQLLAMGGSLMTKYLNLPDEQKQTVRGTWLFTGDVVDLDKDGNVIFLDRKADIITLQDGRKIFAKDIEPVVRQISQIEDVAYIGARDRLKKPVTAIVVVRKAQAALNEKQIRDFLATKLPADRIPTGIFFIDAMPRTISGAVNRAKLRSLYDGV